MTRFQLKSKEKELQIENVVGALKELEKWVPTAGLAMLQVFFPRGFPIQ